MPSLSIASALAAHHLRCLPSLATSSHRLHFAQPTALAPSAARASRGALAIYHARAGAVCDCRPPHEHALSAAHTQSIKRAYMRPDRHGIHGSKNCRRNSVHPPHEVSSLLRTQPWSLYSNWIQASLTLPSMGNGAAFETLDSRE
jgi:hypothetical protein